MSSESPSPSDGDETWEYPVRRRKRIKTSSSRHVRPDSSAQSPQEINISLDSLFDIPLDEADFEDIFPKEEYLNTRVTHLEKSAEPDSYGYRIRPLTIAEIHGLRGWLRGKAVVGTPGWTHGDAILTRRLELRKLTRDDTFTLHKDKPWTQVLRAPTTPVIHAPHDETISALNSIRRTAYECSFASRLRGGCSQDANSPLIHKDSETRVPWLELLADIRLHYYLSHPGCEPPDEIVAPIDYVSLQQEHLPQIHHLLSCTFWSGIDVTQSLHYSPTQCTIVAMYKKLVVGAAFLSSPEVTYLTYVVVRPGWENCHIASIMLYHLSTANPGRDITLHVSANNPSMLLYNKFGFKIEEFIVGFYDDYLPGESKACKNAFRLRLRC